MKRTAMGLLVLVVYSAPVRGDAPEKPSPTFKVDGITIEIDKKLQTNWEFSNFRLTKSQVDLTIEGVAFYRGGARRIFIAGMPTTRTG